MCRDRHLLIGGNIPNFWDLDTAFNSRIRFYVYIPNRGVAWVFEQENNPFSNDVWNRSKNEKGFRKYKNPYLLPNFYVKYILMIGLLEKNLNIMLSEIKSGYWLLMLIKMRRLRDIQI